MDTLARAHKLMQAYISTYAHPGNLRANRDRVFGYQTRQSHGELREGSLYLCVHRLTHIVIAIVSAIANLIAIK